MSGSLRRIWGHLPNDPSDPNLRPDNPTTRVRLEVEGLEVSYGPLKVLHGVTLHVSAGEVVAVLGPNGAGKTTLLRTIAGLLKPIRGTVRICKGQQTCDIAGLPPHRILAHGIAYAAQGQELFPSMTVEENVEMGGYLLRSSSERRSRRDRLLDRFLPLKRRAKQMAGMLSGGERQLLKLSRALMVEPSLLLLDELSSGLAPSLVGEVLRDTRRMADSRGVGILLAEQNVTGALGISDRVYVLSAGRIVAAATPEEIEREQVLPRYYLGATI
jgi:branched-chain amino acid transport system ATP-binding protein